MKETPSLKRLQQGVRDLLTKDEIQISKDFQTPPVGSVDDRLWIYQDGLKQIVLDSLKDDFGLTELLIGRERFGLLAERFTRECPAKTWSLAEYSAAFPAFACFDSNLGSYEFLKDLTTLEWQKILCRQHELPAPFDFESLGQMSEDDLAESSMVLNPSCALMDSSWDLARFLRKDLSAQDIGSLATWVLFQSRSGFTATKLTPVETQVYELFARGLSIEVVSSTLIERNAPEEAVSESVSNWVQSGLITGVQYGR